MKFVVLGVGFPDIVQMIEDLLLEDKNLDFLGFLDDDKNKNKEKIFGYDVLGNLDWIDDNPDVQVFNSIARNLRIRDLINKRIQKKGIGFINLIHPSVNTKFSKLGKGGVLINKNVYLEATSKLGSHSMILQGSSIGHDCSIGENTFIGPGSNILGNVNIGTNCLIGSGTTIYPGVKIGNNSITGINSIILSDVGDSQTISSPPSRKIFSSDSNNS